MEILIAGDFCPHHRTVDLIEREHFKEMFGPIKQIVEPSDYSIVNLECPIVNNEKGKILKQGPNLKSTPKAIKAIGYIGFDCVTLANNHIYDYGDVGIANTLGLLKDCNIDYVGGGADLRSASRSLVRIIDNCRIAIVNCCEHEFSIATRSNGGANPLNPIHQYYAIKEVRETADVVIVIVHGGHEHYQLPSPRMKDTYRFFVDAGADVVINHHQHCFSGYEVYKGKPIFYGLGNFFFDWNGKRNSIWNFGYMVKVSFEGSRLCNFNLIPYKQCDLTPSISLLDGQEEKEFDKIVSRLNAIIENDEVLEQNHIDFLNANKKYYQLSLEPYTTRISKGLYRRGLLPSTLENRRLMLLNNIMCESHYEGLLNSLLK